MSNYRYWVYVDRITPFINTATYWKGFDSKIAALLFKKINGYRLYAKSKQH